ncbi:MAG: aldolase/citrate lyase family protein [Oscillospiraceae bacterium]
MTRLEQLKEKLAARQPVCGTTCGLVLDPILLSKMDHPYMGFMLFDAEHGRYDAQNLVPMLHMCRMMGLPSIVRIQDAFYHLAAKPLDMGADGIMVPRTETVEQLKAVIDGLCFHPVGRKGNGGNLQFYPGESIAHSTAPASSCRRSNRRAASPTCPPCSTPMPTISPPS